MPQLPSGVSGFPITPADPQGRVDAPALRRLLRRLVPARPGQGLGSVGLLGSTGGYPYFTRAERRRAIDAALEELAGRLPVMVGVGALRTDEAVALARDAEAAGADAVLLAPMSYAPLLEEEVAQHVATVAAAVRIPLCLYDNPATTHFTVSPALTARLSRVPNVAGVKHPAPAGAAAAERMRALREAVAPGFSLGWSVDATAVEALLAGGDAWYSVAAGLFPERCVAIAGAARAGDAEAARRLHAGLQPLWTLFAELTSLRVMYAAAELLGLEAGAPPLPIRPLEPPARARVAAVLAGLHLA